MRYPAVLRRSRAVSSRAAVRAVMYHRVQTLMAEDMRNRLPIMPNRQPSCLRRKIPTICLSKALGDLLIGKSLSDFVLRSQMRAKAPHLRG